MMKLVLLRHGQSTWNKENRFTGWTDVDLTPEGVREADESARLLLEGGYTFDVAYTSVLKRAIRTLWIVQDKMDLMWLPVRRHWRLNERHYGALQGLNKAETAARHGDEQVLQWRRSYATPPPPLDGFSCQASAAPAQPGAVHLVEERITGKIGGLDPWACFGARLPYVLQAVRLSIGKILSQRKFPDLFQQGRHPRLKRKVPVQVEGGQGIELRIQAGKVFSLLPGLPPLDPEIFVSKNHPCFFDPGTGHGFPHFLLTSLPPIR